MSLVEKRPVVVFPTLSLPLHFVEQSFISITIALPPLLEGKANECSRGGNPAGLQLLRPQTGLLGLGVPLVVIRWAPHRKLSTPAVALLQLVLFCR
jgi:hypothetical protein